MIWKNLRPYFRGVYRVYNGTVGFLYDYKRYLYFSGWRENLKDLELRNYNTVMAYHGLEKSLSYKNRNPNSGWSNAERVFLRLNIANSSKEFGYHDRAATQVLKRFLDLPSNRELPRTKEMMSFLNILKIQSVDFHGAIEFPLSNFKKGILEKPEDFFFSRYSLREFKNQIVPEEIVQRAIRLAMKTPSVCNRQAWHIYGSSESDIIKKTLHYQNGNKPFGEKVPNLLIVSTDLKAFFAGSEHYQHWIDGGLLSMSIMYALHSLGIASCPLNWSQTPKRDKELRKALRIRTNHTVIMMIALGYPDDENKVCSSSRRPLSEVYSKIELR